MEKHTPEKRRKERIEEVMLEVCIDNSSDYVERTLLIGNGLLILIGIVGRNIITVYNNVVVDLYNVHSKYSITHLP